MNDDHSESRPASSGALAGSMPQGRVNASLDGDIQAKIGQHLRAMYDDVVRQGVPDRFLDLLSQLDGGGAGGKKSDKDPEKGGDGR